MSKLKNQEKAISALLATDTVKKAATECGLSVETLHRYLRDPEFLKEYRLHRRSLLEASMARLQSASDQAVHTLRRNMDAKNRPADQIRAAQLVLENSVKTTEITDILERLEAIENAAIK